MIGRPSANDPEDSWDSVVAKHNSSGEQQWIRNLGGNVTATNLVLSDTGNLYVGGYTRGIVDGHMRDIFEPQRDFFGFNDEDLFIMKYNLIMGVRKWARQAIDVDRNSQTMRGMIGDTTGNIYMIGIGLLVKT